MAYLSVRTPAGRGGSDNAAPEGTVLVNESSISHSPIYPLTRIIHISGILLFFLCIYLSFLDICIYLYLNNKLSRFVYAFDLYKLLSAIP